MRYQYPYRSGSLGVMASKMVDAGLPAPMGLASDGVTGIGIEFEPDITPPQKATLDAIMADENVGQIPPSTNSIYDFRDPCVFEDDFNAALAQHNISVRAFPNGPGDIRLIFNKKLTAQELNQVQVAAWTSLMVKIQ
jgi:hypothetical protein